MIISLTCKKKFKNISRRHSFSKKAKMNDLILALDVSTTTIGLSLLGLDGSLKRISHISLGIDKKYGPNEGLFIKKKIFQAEFEKILEMLKQSQLGVIKYVVIEEPLYNSNNTYTCQVLLRFNGIIANYVYETVDNVIPQYISSHNSRQWAFPELVSVRTKDKNGNPIPESKIKKSKPTLFGDYPKDVDKKLIIWQKVNARYPDIQWVYDKKGELKKVNFDATDSVCVGLAFIAMMKAGVNPEDLQLGSMSSKKKKVGNISCEEER